MSTAGAWSDFSRCNAGPDIEQRAILGSLIYTHFSGPEIRALYRQVFARVRETQVATQLPYRCDAPDRRRRMVMTISPLPGSELRVENRLMAIEEREAVQLLAPRGRGIALSSISICSVCRRVHDTDGRWKEIENATVAAVSLDSHAEEAPALVEKVCDQCETIAAGCEYMLSGTERASGSLRPMVVFLHGSTHDRYLLRINAPPRMWDTLSYHDALLFSPIHRKPGPWETSKLLAQVEAIAAEHAVDPRRIYLTGISNGAIAVWTLLRQAPHLFAAAVPIAGLPAGPQVEKFGDAKIWAFHGAHDNVTPIGPVRALLRDSGPRHRLTTFDDGSHEVWGRAYLHPGLWEWLFSQARAD